MSWYKSKIHKSIIHKLFIDALKYITAHLQQLQFLFISPIFKAQQKFDFFF